MTGLGLASAQAFATDHGGRIYAESSADAGITLRLEFPAVPAGRPRLAARPASAERAHLPAREKPRAALPPAPEPVEAVAPEPPSAAPAEPVQVAVVEAAAAPERRKEPSRALRGLMFTE
jgi:hypothetical protein